MARLFFVGLFWLVLVATQGLAAGYDHFAEGLSAVDRGDNDTAITEFTAALAAGDLNANLVPVAYFQRARAHWAKEDCAGAIPDFSAAIKLRANYLEAILSRGGAELCAGDNAASIADFTQAIALRPDATGFWSRGRARWAEGDYAGASQDFAESVKRNGHNSYFVLWLAVAQQRAGTFDDKAIADAADGLDLDRWPGPLVEFYRGRLKIDDLMQAAAKGEAKTAAEQHCEASFYIAEWWLGQHNADSAKPLLEDAKANCPKDFVEFNAAEVELKRVSESTGSRP